MKLPDLVRGAEPSVIRILSPAGTGTGFIYDDSGLAVTNAHVIGSNSFVEVEFSRQKCLAKLVGKDDVVDLAVMQIFSEIDKYPKISIGNSDDVNRGDDVLAIGYPLGEILRGSPTVTRGIVSAKGNSGAVSYLQTDAAINPGNSGGPLLNYYGEVVGVISSKIHQHGENAVEGIGLAIHTSELTDRIWRLEHAISVKETFTNWIYDYSFNIPQGWHPKPIENWSQVIFSTDDGQGVFRVDAIDMSSIGIRYRRGKEVEGLQKFLEWIVSDSTDSFKFSDDFELDVPHMRATIDHIASEDNGEGDIVKMQGRINLSDHVHSTSDVIMCELPRDIKENKFGFYVTTYVYNDYLSMYDSDREIMLDSFQC